MLQARIELSLSGLASSSLYQESWEAVFINTLHAEFAKMTSPPTRSFFFVNNFGVYIYFFFFNDLVSYLRQFRVSLKWCYRRLARSGSVFLLQTERVKC